MNLKVKECYCLIGEKENVISVWEMIKKRGEYLVCTKKHEKGGLTLCCFSESSTKPLFKIDCVHSYQLTKHGIIVARREYINETSYFIRYGIMSYIGKPIALMEYSKITSLNNEDYFCLQKNIGDPVNLYNYNGEMILSASCYNSISEFSDGVIYEEKGKKGLYFFKSKKKIEPRYTNVMPVFGNVIVKDYISNKLGLLSSLGETILYTMYDYIEDILQGSQFVTKKDDEYYIYTSKGELINSGKYEYITIRTEYVYTYCEIKLREKEDTFLYIPSIYTFIKGKNLRVRMIGKVQYQDKDTLQWHDIGVDMYGNANRIKDLYQYEEETK